MTQKERVLDWFDHWPTITRRLAMIDLNILNLPARIGDLRSDGHEIVTEEVKSRNGVRYARYRLVR